MGKIKIPSFEEMVVLSKAKRALKRKRLVKRGQSVHKSKGEDVVSPVKVPPVSLPQLPKESPVCSVPRARIVGSFPELEVRYNWSF